MTATIRIGEWELDAEGCELRRGAESVHLESKTVEVLRQLALKPGRVLGRDELLSLAWPGVVVGDDALTQAIIKLRKALGDDAQDPRYIETIPKRGYRLIAKVETPGQQGPLAAATVKPARRGRALAFLAAILAIAGIATYVTVQRAGMPWPIATDGKERALAGSFPVVAVLPLANLSGDARRDYLADGLTEDIIGALGRFSGVRVMSWNSVRGLRGAQATREGVQQALRARYLVQGSVREADGSVRLAVELSDAEKGTQLWAAKFDGQGPQLFEIQDRIVRQLVGSLAVRLTHLEQQRAFALPTESAEAYDLVLRARALHATDERSANRAARELLARARKLAPDYDEAWIASGEAEWSRAAFGWIEDPEEGVRRAEEHARRALQSPDPRARSRALSLIATLRTHAGHPEEAIQHTTKAIEMNPSDTSALFRHGHALLALGRPEEAIATYETAMRYEPKPTIGPHAQLAAAYYAAGRYQDCARQAETALASLPRSFALYSLRAAALAQLGRIEEARAAAEMVRKLNPAYDAGTAGTRLRPDHAEKLREGLAKAGL